MKHKIIDRKKKRIMAQYVSVVSYAYQKPGIIHAFAAGKKWMGLRIPSQAARRCRELVETRYMTREWTKVKGRAYKLFFLTKKGMKVV